MPAPAEPPVDATRVGSRFHVFALARRNCTARAQSSIGAGYGATCEKRYSIVENEMPTERHSSISTVLFDECLPSGISFATIEYRFSQVAPYPAPMLDCARAVQFIRAHAKQWNIDPTRIASTGGSAGAGISLWLAFHDDMANPQSTDPVGRQSTRLRCALVTGIQSTYDPREIRNIVPGNAYDAQPIKQLFGLPDTWNWDRDKVDSALDARLKDASPITHLTKDDVPVFVISYASMNVPGDPHHSNFAKHLKGEMDRLGIECVIHMDTDYQGGMAEAHKEMGRWMKKHFGMQ
jgi:acetyl esterase